MGEHIAPRPPLPGNAIDSGGRALLPRQRSGGDRFDGSHPLRSVAQTGETPPEAPAAGTLAQRVGGEEKDQCHASDRDRRFKVERETHYTI